MKWLLTSDLHMTDRPKDSYRFGLFKWLAQQQKNFNTDATFILGDLTENKDRHSSKLVNKLIDELTKLRPPVYILRGNHDGLDPDNPFFRFMNCIEGMQFVVSPEEVIPGLFMIPHQRTQKEFDVACNVIKPNALGVMVHQTFDGAITETNRRLSGLSTSLVESKHPGAVWAGDIHKPQQAGAVTYVGSPFHIRFGDQFTPRVLLIDGSQQKNLYFECPRKWALTVTSSKDLETNKQLRQRDQLKLTINLTREEFVEWKTYKQRCLDVCRAKGIEVYDVSLDVIGGHQIEQRIKHVDTTDAFKAFCVKEKLPNATKQAGLAIIKGD